MPPSIYKSSAHGADIPIIGIGTGGLSENCGDVIAGALRAGYRHIDTARNYGTEQAVGEAIRDSRIERNKIFVTTKVSHEDLHVDNFERSTETSLRVLGLDWVDLLLVHWPPSNISLQAVMSVLAKMKRRGLTRHIGVANFNIALAHEATQMCPEPLTALQAEYHPYLDQSKLIEACRRLGLVFIAYCPLARGRVIGDPVIGEIARVKGKTAAQIALHWLVQQDSVVAIPRSSSAFRLMENIDVFDFKLSDDEVTRIEALKRSDGRIANPVGLAPVWDR
jgi:diketogulonate reductase-like aldo/keto reductase